jgi:hypothetical protein
MGEAFVQGITRRVDDVGRCIEIGFPDLEMDNVATLCLQRTRLHQDFEGGLRTKTRHAFREAKLVGLVHHAQSSSSRRFSQLSTISAQRLPSSVTAPDQAHGGGRELLHDHDSSALPDLQRTRLPLSSIR